MAGPSTTRRVEPSVRRGYAEVVVRTGNRQALTHFLFDGAIDTSRCSNGLLMLGGAYSRRLVGAAGSYLGAEIVPTTSIPA